MLRSILVGTLTVFILSDGETQPPAKRGNLTVTLLAPDGKTVLRGARVVLAPAGVDLNADSPRRLIGARDEQGGEILESVEYGVYRLAAYWQELHRRPFRPTLPPAFSAEVEINAPNRVLSVTVKGIHFLLGRLTEADGKTPVAEADLQLRTTQRKALGDSVGFEYRSARTNDEGRFFFPQPPAEECLVSVRMTSRWPQKLATLTPRADGDTVRNLSLPTLPAMTGRIVDTDGKPVARAAAQFRLLCPGVGIPDFEVTTDGEGRYRIPRVPPAATRSYVRVAGQGYAFGGAPDRGDEEPLRVADFNLQPFATVALTVRRRGGQPAGGVRLNIDRETFDGDLPGMPLLLPPATTDKNGHCTLTEVPEGTYCFASTPNAGHPTPSMFSVAAGQKLSLTVTLPAPKRTDATVLRGRVVDAHGRPVEGAEVYLNPDLKGWGVRGGAFPAEPVRSAGDGAFTIAGERLVFGRLLAVPPGRPHGWLLATGLESDGAPLTVVLPPVGGYVEGRLLSEGANASVAGVTVGAIPDLLSIMEFDLKRAKRDSMLLACSGPFPHTTTDATGHYRLGPLAPGGYTVVAVGADFGPVVAEGVCVPRRQGAPVAINFQPVPAAALMLSLRLTDDRGTPLANLPVNAQSRLVYETVTTDAEGRLTLEMPELGRHEIRLKVESYESAGLTALLARDTPSPAGLMDMRLAPVRHGAAVVTVVQDDTGEPVAGIAVSATSGEPSGVTDRAGQARLQQLPAGKCVLVAAPPAGNAGGKVYAPGVSEELEILPERAAPAVTIRLPVAGSVSGHVTDAEGKPVAGARVTVSPEAPALRQLWRLWQNCAAATDPNGAFSIRGLAPGEWTLYASATDGNRRLSGGCMVLVTSGRESEKTRLRATDWRGRPTTVKGQVFEPDGRTPAVAALVKCVESRHKVFTDAGGKFALRIHSQTPATVEAWLPGVGVAVSEPLSPHVPEHEIRLLVQRGATLEGRVLGTSGAPLPNAEIIARPASTATKPRERYSLTRRTFRARTDAAGRFRLNGIPPGQWRLHAEVGHVRRTRHVTLNLPRRALRGIRKGTNLAALVWLSDWRRPDVGRGAGGSRSPAHLWPFDALQSAGQPLLRCACPADFRLLRVTRTALLRRQTAKFMSSAAPSQFLDGIELTIEPLIPEVRGRVLAPDGKTPLAGVSVTLSEPGLEDFAATARTDSEGTYLLRWLPPGEYSVRVECDDPRLALLQKRAVVFESSTGPDFRLPRSGSIVGRVVGFDPTSVGRGWQIRTFAGRWPTGASDVTEAGTRVSISGTYRLGRLAPGEYTVHHFTRGSEEAPRSRVKVVVHEGSEARAPDLIGTR